MLDEIFLKKVNDIEVVAKEEKYSGTLHIFSKSKLLEKKYINVNWIVYLEYCKKNNLLIGSGYGDGEIFSISLCNNKFSNNINIYKEIDNTDKKSRSHSIVLDRGENYAYSANIGLDKIFIYKVEKDKLDQIGKFSLPDGTGPRHITFNKKLDIMYVISENSNEIFVFNHNPITGEIILLEQKSTLPIDFCGISYGQTLIIQNDNKFLLANNRGADTVAIFEILSDGKVNKVADLDCKLFDFYRAEENIYGL